MFAYIGVGLLMLVVEVVAVQVEHYGQQQDENLMDVVIPSYIFKN
jgi:Na+-translocating ferredoxin:NAD+ oxidoreductase RnfG subunit